MQCKLPWNEHILSHESQYSNTSASSPQEVIRSTDTSTYLSPHEAPPQALKSLFKSWKSHSSALGIYGLDPPGHDRFSEIALIQVRKALQEFYSYNQNQGSPCDENAEFSKIYSSQKIPGLLVAPALLPPQVQKEILSRLLHRDLSNPEHKTNLHPHYEISYPNEWESFFSKDPSTIAFISKQKNGNKNINCRKALDKKLRWMTLGVQYDWTSKEYTKDKGPKLPMDIFKLINDLFPNIEPQTAIVNIYSPGDTLCLHRDVSEEIDRGLVSISLGCAAYFIISLHDKETKITASEVLLIRSGDVLCMTEESRYAWHGVPIIIENSCPDYLEDWPGDDFPVWKGWMKTKRINLNVRQIWEELK